MVSAVHLHGCCGPEPPGGPAVPMWGQEMEGGANCQGQGVPALCGLSHREGVLGDRSLHAERALPQWRWRARAFLRQSL